MMPSLSVLLTNNALCQRGGSETYVRDVALALLRRGHRPTVFSLVHGDMAADLRRATVPVIDNVTHLGQSPDVIHGHHHLETLIAALAFPDAPVVNFCHGWTPWEEMPLHHPAVRRYVAVDEVCVDRLVREEGLPLDRVDLLLNFVDLERFRPRPALPLRPARALILSNAATAGGYAGPIRAACADAGIPVDIIGGSAGNATGAPEALLTEYDLVFAKGRTALEALAVGCATVLADQAGAGPLVTPANYEGLRVRNFGIRELRHGHDAAWYRAQIAGYDAHLAQQVCARVRAEAGLEPAMTRLLDIYASAMATPRGREDPSRAAAIHCSRLALPLKQAYGVADRLTIVTGELAAARAEIETLTADASHSRAQIDAGLAAVARLEALSVEAKRSAEQARAAADRERAAANAALQRRIDTLVAQAGPRDDAVREAERQSASTRQQLRALQRQVAAFQALPTLRLRDAVLRAPGFGAVVQKLARGLASRLASRAASDAPGSNSEQK